MQIKTNCPNCFGSSIIKTGFSLNKQRYKCLLCNKRFVSFEPQKPLISILANINHIKFNAAGIKLLNIKKTDAVSFYKDEFFHVVKDNSNGFSAYNHGQFVIINSHLCDTIRSHFGKLKNESFFIKIKNNNEMEIFNKETIKKVNAGRKPIANPFIAIGSNLVTRFSVDARLLFNFKPKQSVGIAQEDENIYIVIFDDIKSGYPPSKNSQINESDFAKFILSAFSIEKPKKDESYRFFLEKKNENENFYKIASFISLKKDDDNQDDNK